MLRRAPFLTQDNHQTVRARTTRLGSPARKVRQFLAGSAESGARQSALHAHLSGRDPETLSFRSLR